MQVAAVKEAQVEPRGEIGAGLRPVTSSQGVPDPCRLPASEQVEEVKGLGSEASPQSPVKDKIHFTPAVRVLVLDAVVVNGSSNGDNDKIRGMDADRG
jgi:hypothetical protein